MHDRRLDKLFLRFQRAGDIGALAGVFDLAAPELLAVARHLTREESRAEDALQQTFLVAIEKRAEFDARARLLPWLLGILVRQVRQGWARDARRPDPARLSVRVPEDPVRLSAARELDELVERSLDALPADTAVALRHYLRQEKSAAEIGRALGITANAASVRIHRGLALLRRNLPRGAAIGTAAALADAQSTGVSAAALPAIRGHVLAHAGATVPSLTVASTAGLLTIGGLVVSKLTLLSSTAALVLAAALARAHYDHSTEQRQLEAEVARLEAQLSEGLRSPAVAAGPSERSEAPRPVTEAPRQTSARAASTSQPVLDPRYWLTRFQRAKNWREARTVAKELAALGDDHSLAILRVIFHDIPGASSRVEVLGAFVRGGGRSNAVEVLHLGATDPEVQVREAAFEHLTNYAFVNFKGDPSGYVEWYARFGGRAIPEILEMTTRELVQRIGACSEADLESVLEVARRVDPKTGHEQGVDVRALLEAAGLVVALERRIHPSADPRALVGALRCLGDLDMGEAVLRRTVLPILETPGLYPQEARAGAFQALGHSGARWAVEPILGALLTTAPETSTYFSAAQALSEIGDPTIIPTLIGMIVAHDGYETRYGIGYFGLRSLTGVDYDESHDAAFWLDWWERNRAYLPEEVRGLSIPRIVLPASR
jgi:RNA polymerase sigma-70 factor (ECF subfamily)